MKQNTGWMAAIGVAIAAIFGFSVLPSRNAGPPAGAEGGQPKATTAAEAASSNLEVLKLPCREIEKRILEFLPEQKLFAPDECYEKGGPKASWTPADEAASPELHFLIATLPNPVHTHFALEFDRLTDALQQAAQDQGYNYDSSWLPWVQQPQRYGGLSDQDKSDERRHFREKQPGVLVFRSALPDCGQQDAQQKDVQQGANPGAKPNCIGRPYEQGLLVFVVGENPTGGIDSEQFQRAIAWIRALRPGGTKSNLRILSPFFSGSFSSLARLLTTGEPYAYIVANKASIPGAGAIDNLSAVEVFSGSASAQPGISWFQQFLAQQKLGSFRTFQESDDLVINRYCRLLKRQGYDTGRLAIVSEDETAYGAVGANARVAESNRNNRVPALYECIQPVNDGIHGPLNLYYPRDIASLRSAYARQGIFGGVAQQGTETGLPQNLSESDSSEHDTIRSYGGEQSPQSQEATLFALVNLLRAHRTEFIILRSSNALDQIFLTQFFARTYPDARVVILNSDVMFRRSTESQGFRGTMTLSTYPLLTWEQDWTFYQLPESRHSHRAFPDANAEGLYLASRFLIHLQNSELGPASPEKTPLCLGPVDSPSPVACGSQGSSVLVQDYGPPSWLLKEPLKAGDAASPTRPPTWLSVLSSGQVWPVAIIDEETIPQNPAPSERKEASTSDRSVLPPAYTNATKRVENLLLLPLPIRVWFSVAFAWCLWHLYCCWTGSQTGLPKSRAYFAPVPGPQHHILIFFGSVLFALLAIVMAMLTGSFSPDSSGYPFLHQLVAIITATLTGEHSAVWPSPFVHQWRMNLLYWLLLLLGLTALIANYLRNAQLHRSRMCGGEGKAEDKYHAANAEEDQEQEKHRGHAGHSSHAAHHHRGPEGSGEQLARNVRLWFVKRRRHLINWEARLRRHPRKLALFAGLLYVAVTLLLADWLYHTLVENSKDPTRVFVFWRSVNMFTGVSPLLPFLVLIVGLYAWFWYTLSGVALFNRDRPQLPISADLPENLPMFGREAGHKIERLAKPLSGGYGLVLPGLLFGLLFMFFFFVRSDDFAVRSLGAKPYGQMYFVWLSVCIALIVTDAFQLLRIWARLRKLLVYLDRLPLRRTLHALRGFSWGTVWKMSGSVLDQRYRLLSRQLESFLHLKNELERLGSPTLNQCFYKRLATCEASGAAFVAWYVNNCRESRVTDVKPMERHQEELARTAGAVCKQILLPEWRNERCSLIQDLSQGDRKGPEGKSPTESKPELPSAPLPNYMGLSEEFFALPYLGFVQNILGRMRTIAIGMLWLFVAATISVASYPFDPRPLLGGIFVFVFILVAAITIYVYAQMHRDTTLSYITNTNPGELGMDFWIKLVALGIGPLAALLTALFPDMASFFTSWMQPSVQAIK